MKGEERIERDIEVRTIIDDKVNSYRLPFEELTIEYNQKLSPYSEEEDRFLVSTRMLKYIRS